MYQHTQLFCLILFFLFNSFPFKDKSYVLLKAAT